jgi:predicted Rossmann fold nucleotide-binding protein DprA/Smf involved in DNA uptake
LIKNGAKIITTTYDILNEFNLKDIKTTQINSDPANNEEKLIIESLQNEPLPIDKIIEKTKLSAQAVATTLALMEISGKVQNLKANTYSLN